MKTSVLSYNQKCRKVLADKRILSYLIKITILPFSHLSIDEIETLIEEDVLVKAKMHTLFAKRNEIVMESGKIVYDLLFTLKLPDKESGYIVNVELQNNYYPTSADHKRYSLLKRAMYYGSVSIMEEKGNVFVKDNYQDMKKVISIWINTKVPQKKANTITHYEMKVVNQIGKSYKEKKENYDVVEVIMVNLGKDHSLPELEPLNLLFIENDYEDVYRILKEQYGIEVYEETRNEVEEMCNLGEALVMESERKGKRKGKRIGKREEQIRSIKSIMETMNVSYEEATRLLKLNKKEIHQYRRLLSM